MVLAGGREAKMSRDTLLWRLNGHTTILLVCGSCLKGVGSNWSKLGPPIRGWSGAGVREPIEEGEQTHTPASPPKGGRRIYIPPPEFWPILGFFEFFRGAFLDSPSPPGQFWGYVNFSLAKILIFAPPIMPGDGLKTALWRFFQQKL